MKSELAEYLNDHLGGSAGALKMIDQLIEHATDAGEESFFSDLKEKVSADQKLLETLLESGGAKPSALRKAAGGFAMRLGSIKLISDGLESGELGKFESLELIALGVHGKRLLWAALGALETPVEAWRQHDFSALGQEAIRQRDAIEKYRIAEAKATFEGG